MTLRRAALFSLHQRRASVQLCLFRASSIRRISENKSRSTSRYVRQAMRTSNRQVGEPKPTSIPRACANFFAVLSFPERSAQSVNHRSRRVSAHRSKSGPAMDCIDSTDESNCRRSRITSRVGVPAFFCSSLSCAGLCKVRMGSTVKEAHLALQVLRPLDHSIHSFDGFIRCHLTGLTLLNEVRRCSLQCAQFFLYILL